MDLRLHARVPRGLRGLYHASLGGDPDTPLPECRWLHPVVEVDSETEFAQRCVAFRRAMCHSTWYPPQ